MNLMQLLQQHEDALRLQVLNLSITNVSTVRGATKVTFMTDAMTPGEVALGEEKIGVVVWIPRELAKQIPRPEVKA